MGGREHERSNIEKLLRSLLNFAFLAFIYQELYLPSDCQITLVTKNLLVVEISEIYANRRNENFIMKSVEVAQPRNKLFFC